MKFSLQIQHKSENYMISLLTNTTNKIKVSNNFFFHRLCDRDITNYTKYMSHLHGT